MTIHIKTKILDALPHPSWLCLAIAAAGVVLMLASDAPGAMRYAGTVLAIVGLVLGMLSELATPIQQDADVEGGAR